MMGLTTTEIKLLALGGEPDSDPRDAVAELDRDIAEEQDFDAVRRRTLDRGEPAAREGRAE